MSIGPATAAAVVVAQQFNPSVASQKWLYDIGLLTQADLERPFAFTPAFAQFTGAEFSFLLLPERLQFTMLGEPAGQREILIDKLARFVREVPHTPFTALGLNLTYQIVPTAGDTTQITRRLFFVPGSPLHAEFDDDGARFGGYMSRDVLGCRLKLAVRPAIEPLVEGGPPKHFVAMDFNFHHDLTQGGDAAETIVKNLEKWDDVRDLADRIVRIVLAKDKK